MLEVEALSPFLGADVRGIDLRAADAPMVAALKRSIAAHKVLRFRGQRLDAGPLVRLARMFGPVRGRLRFTRPGSGPA